MKSNDILISKINENIGFFDDETFQEAKNTFEPYINAKRHIINGQSKYNGAAVQKVKISRDVLSTAELINSISDINQKYNINNDGNYAFTVLPNIKYNNFNERNRFNTFQILLPKGENDYLLANATLKLVEKDNQKWYEVEKLIPTNDVFLKESAKSLRTSTNKVFGGITTLDHNGARVIKNADYDYIFEKIMEYNSTSAFNNQNADNSITKTVINVGFQASKKESAIVDILNATQVQGSNSIRNGLHNQASKTIAISGADLSKIINDEKINKIINKDNAFLINFNNGMTDIESINEYSFVNDYKNKTGQFDNFKLKNLTNNNEVISKAIKENRIDNGKFFERVGYTESKFRYSLTPEEVTEYNKIITRIHEGKVKNVDNAVGRLAECIILNEQVKALDSYGLRGALGIDFEIDNKFTDSSLINKRKYVEMFKQYYNQNKDSVDGLNGIYSTVFDKYSTSELALNIKNGNLFDTYKPVGKQSAVQSGKINLFSQADLVYPLGYKNTDLQRKSQAADRYEKAIIKTSQQDIDITKTTTGFFSSIEEMKYKQTEVEYLQGNELIKKAAVRAGLTEDQTPKIMGRSAKILYADTDLAFQDSDVFTNSFSLQNVSMFNNNKPISIPYSSLKSEAFGNVNQKEINEFLSSLQNANYDINKVQTESGIEKNIIKNLLGEENYNKYLIGQSNDFYGDLKNVGKPLEGIKSISENEAAYIKASSQTAENFNEWTKKYLLRANSEAKINLISPDVVNKGVNARLIGSNFAFIENISFDKNGINFQTKQIVVQSEGSKVLLDNVKGTTQSFSDLLAIQLPDNTKRYFEGAVNEKMTKGSRGFSGTFFARSLLTMASNSLQGELSDGSDLLPDGTINYKARFDNFKNIMSNIKIPTSEYITSDGKKLNGAYNLFDLFNIDLRYENGMIVFDDKNVASALTKMYGSEEELYVGLNSHIIETANQNLKKIFKRNFVAGEESEVLGSFVADFMYSGYDNVLKTMNEKSAKEQQILYEGVDVLKSYISNGEAGMAKVNKVSKAYLFNSNIAMMLESKKRNDTDGLKLGRLSEIVFNELNFKQMTNFIRDKSAYEGQKTLEKYLSLAAIEGTDFARGTPMFNQIFGSSENVIDMLSDNFKYNPLGTNMAMSQYLEDSPLGRLLKYDAEAEKLTEDTAGIITGFSKKFIKNINNVFSDDRIVENYKDINKTFFYTALETANGKSFNKNVMDFLDKNLDLDSIKSLEVADNANDFIDKYKVLMKSIFSTYKGADAENVLNAIEKIKPQSKSANIIKSGMVFANSFADTSFKTSGFTLADDLLNTVGKFSLDKGTLFKLRENFYNNTNKDISVLAGVFSDFDNLNPLNLGENLRELRSIGKFGNIPYLIDSISVDERGNIVPNKVISNIEKIIKTNADLSNLEQFEGKFSGKEYERIKKALGNNGSIKTPEDIQKIREKIYQFYRQNSKNGEKIDPKELKEMVNKFYRINTMIEGSGLEGFLSFDNKSIFEMVKDSNISNYEINAKFIEFKENIKSNGLSVSINSLVKKISGENSGEVSRTLYELIKSEEDPTKIYNKLNKVIDLIKSTKKDNNLINDIRSFQSEIADFVGGEYKAIISQYAQKTQQANNFFNQIGDEAYLKNKTYGELLTEIKTFFNGFSTREERFNLRQLQQVIFTDSSVSTKINNKIKQRKIDLVNVLLSRNKTLAQEIVGHGGKLYELGSVSISESAAFSPREGSIITNFIRNEMENILKGKISPNSSTNIQKEYDDLFKSLKLLYGDDLIKDIQQDFDKVYRSKGKITNDMIDASIKEIKSKLDFFSNVAIADDAMLKKINKTHLFENDQVVYGILSRHPHQYKNSLFPTRFVRITEDDKKMSFFRQMFGEGKTIDSTQSNMIFIGKRTALGANGDFDGDVFQSMFIRNKDLNFLSSANEKKKFMRAYNSNLKLYYFLNNMNEDLEEIMNHDEFEISGIDKKYKKLKKLISNAYFDGAPTDTFTYKEAYKSIEDIYLSLRHEQTRVLNKLNDEAIEHYTMPIVKGFFENGNNKISRQTLSNFVLNLNDQDRFAYLTGQMKKEQLLNLIESSPDSLKNELKKVYEIDNGDFLHNLIKKKIFNGDGNSLSWRGLFDDINKFLDDAGSAKTGQVHSKLTNFRQTVSAMTNPAFIRALKEDLSKYDQDLYLLDPKLVYRGTQSNNIGELIEKLAISAKKGMTDPNLKLALFDKSIGLIKHYDEVSGSYSLEYNFKKMSNFVYALNKKNASKNSLKNSVETIENMNFDQWFRSMYTVHGEKGEQILKGLKRSFLLLNDISDVESKISDKSLSLKEILSIEKNGKKSFSNTSAVKLSTIMANWNIIMYKGEVEKALNIEDIGEGSYRKMFKRRQTNFIGAMKNIVEYSRNPLSRTDTRSNSNIIFKVYKKIEEKIKNIQAFDNSIEEVQEAEGIFEKLDKGIVDNTGTINTNVDNVSKEIEKDINQSTVDNITINKEEKILNNGVEVEEVIKEKSKKTKTKKTSSKKTKGKNNSDQMSLDFNMKVPEVTDAVENIENENPHIISESIDAVSNKESDSAKELLEKRLEQLQKELDDKVQFYESENKKLSSEIEDGKNEINNLKGKIKDFTNDAKKSEKAQKKLEQQLDKTTKNLNSKIENKEQSNKKITEEIKTIKNELKNSEKEKKKLERQLEKTSKELNSKIEKSQKVNKKSLDQIENYKKEIANLKEQIKKINGEFKDSEKVKKQLERQLEKINKELNSKIQTGQEFNKKTSEEINVYKREVEELKQQIKNHNNNFKNSEKAKEKLEKELERTTKELNSKIENANQMNEKAIEEINSYRKEITHLQDQIKNKDNQFAESEKIRKSIEKQLSEAQKSLKEKIEINQNLNEKLSLEINSYKKEIENLKANLKNMEAQKAQVKTSDSDKLLKKVEELEKDLKIKEERIEKAKQIYKQQTEEISKLKNKLVNVEAKIGEYETKLSKIKNDSKVKSYLSHKNEQLNTFVKEKIGDANLDEVKKNLSKHKNKAFIAGGVAALGLFFRIFQKRRPVVNLDINEEEYERSQGSIYRNLGQYTMNTNIRSLY